jgi:serine/threonine-protein kinase RsbW
MRLWLIFKRDQAEDGIVIKHGRLPPFAVTIAGRENAVRGGLAQIMMCLKPLGLTVDDAGTVELVLAETLNNIVEHALATTQDTTIIEVRGSHNSLTGLRVTVIDQGKPMPTGTAPVAKAPDVDVAFDDLPEGGFGWFMIHTLATEVTYSRIGQSNHLGFLIDVGR